MTDKGKKKKIFYEINKIYSITINFNDQSQYRRIKNPYTRFHRFKELIYDTIGNGKDIRYLLHFDISEPLEMMVNKYPRIHMHGCIKFLSNEAIRDWLMTITILLSKVAYVNIDTIEDISIWQEYCTKYDHITGVIPIQNKMAWGNKKNKESKT